MMMIIIVKHIDKKTLSSSALGDNFKNILTLKVELLWI